MVCSFWDGILSVITPQGSEDCIRKNVREQAYFKGELSLHQFLSFIKI